MKKVIFTIALAVASVGAYANTNTLTNVEIVTVNNEDKKVEIEAAKLPEAITKVLAETKKDSKIVKAFQILGAEDKVLGYEVILLTEGAEETLALSETGVLKS